MLERSTEIVGQKIAYTESAGTGRPVVLVHGNSSSARTWQPLLTGPFGEQFRCLALDLPGHGRSAPAARPGTYSLPGYAEVLTEFARATDTAGAIFVGWSLGGHVVLEAASDLPEAAGFLLFGTPPVGTPAHLAEAFLPNPAMNVGFTAEVDTAAALSYATSFLAPDSAFPRDGFVADILATDSAARAGLFSSIGEGRFADEVDVVARLTRPLAILQGVDEQFVSLEYLRGLVVPTLWRGAVQMLAGAGHAPHLEAPQEFAALLTRFVTDVG
jgi:pimeloyl-ACP methyl ester carboxylesterase